MFSRKVGFAAAAMTLWGCAAEGPEDVAADDDAADKRPAYGVVVIERVESVDLARSSVSAKFMRVAANDRTVAEQLVGAGPALPGPGECQSLESLDASPIAAPAPGFAVELLDVGDLVLVVRDATVADAAEAAVTQIALAPRAFPDVGDLASGVFYTSPDADVPLPAPASYALESSGSDLAGDLAADAGRFVIEVAGPRPPSDVTVAGERVSGDDDEKLEVLADADIAVRWQASDATEASMIYVDVLGEQPFRCAFPDRGEAILPRGVLSSEDVGREATISIHRVSEGLVPLRGGSGDALADAEARVRFDLATAARVHVK